MALNNIGVEILDWFMDTCKGYNSGYFKTVDAYNPKRKTIDVSATQTPFCGIEPLVEGPEEGGASPVRDMTFTVYVIGNYGTTRSEKTAFEAMETFTNWLRMRTPPYGKLEIQSIAWSAEYLMFPGTVETFSLTLWASFAIVKLVGVPLTQNP
jgi:hypothetical protein